MHTVKALREQMQLALPVAEMLQRRDGRNDVIAVGAGPAVALPHVMQLLLERQPSGILRVAAIDHVAERWHPLLGLLLEPYRPRAFTIYGGYLLAFAEISDGARRARPR